MRVLLIEDEFFAAERLKKLLFETGKDIEVVAVLDSIKSSVKWLREHPLPDLLFLDIQLADGLSFSIFEQVKIQLPVIFTTAFDEYAIRAFELHSIDYLLKPIDPLKLQAALDKFNELSSYYKQTDMAQFFKILREDFSSPKVYKSRFMVNKADTLVTIPIDQVAFFFAEDKTVVLYSKEGNTHVLHDTLDRLEELVDPAVFFRVNRQCLLGISAISKVHHYFNYKLKIETKPAAPVEVIVSKLKVQQFKEWLNS
jgi:DNA-binding LytR/AlgR family response regulator